MKKSLSGPDIVFSSTGRDYQTVDIEGQGSPLAKRHTTPTPLLPQAAGAFSTGGPGSLHSARERRNKGLAAAAGVSYVISSAALILLNKKVLVHYSFSSVHSLLFYHCLLAVLLARVIALLGLGRIEPLTWQVARMWMPVNLIFVAMLATNFYALEKVGVGMVSILKNLSNVFIIAGDYWYFRRSYSWQVYACLALMIASVMTGGATDAQFSASGYAWQLANCVFSAAYALYLSKVTERLTSGPQLPPIHGAGGAGGATPGPGGPGGGRVNELSMSFYNNLLSLPLAFGMMLLSGELSSFWREPALSRPSFAAYATLGGAFGYAISFTSIWYVTVTTATLYSLTGSMNKVLVAVLGIWMFNESTAPQNLASIGIGLAAGGLLPYIKMRQAGGHGHGHGHGRGGAGDGGGKSSSAGGGGGGGL